jgi:uncharacterized protein YdhG (YjbR/CyaY superfamily)
MSNAQITAHLKKLSLDQRKILSDLRDHIASKLPTAEQVIKYGIPTRTTTAFFLTADPLIRDSKKI